MAKTHRTLPAVLAELPVLVAFAYEHSYRLVEVTRTWLSAEGHVILTGVDQDVDAYRSFRLDQIPCFPTKTGPRPRIRKVRGCGYTIKKVK